MTDSKVNMPLDDIIKFNNKNKPAFAKKGGQQQYDGARAAGRVARGAAATDQAENEDRSPRKEGPARAKGAAVNRAALREGGAVNQQTKKLVSQFVNKDLKNRLEESLAARRAAVATTDATRAGLGLGRVAARSRVIARNHITAPVTVVRRQRCVRPGCVIQNKIVHPVIVQKQQRVGPVVVERMVQFPEPNFEYKADDDGWVPIPCRLEPERENEIIDIEEIDDNNGMTNGPANDPSHTPQPDLEVPDTPKPEPDQPSSQEETPVLQEPRWVNGYRCYYNDDELVGCAPVPAGAIRASGYEYWSEVAKRNHIRRDELRREVLEFKREAQLNARRLALIRAGAKNLLPEPVVNGKNHTVFAKQLKVGPSLIHGKGLYAMEPIRKSESVIEYIGERITMEETDERETMYAQAGLTSTYFFRIGETDQVLDATKVGNNSRYINHSCDPNCSSRIVSKTRIVIFCVRDIKPGEEITYDYRLPCEDMSKKIHCLCGASNCRSYMNYNEAVDDRQRREIGRIEDVNPVYSDRKGGRRGRRL